MSDHVEPGGGPWRRPLVDWTISGALAFMLCAGLWAAAPTLESRMALATTRLDIERVTRAERPVVVIGTSLSRNALPEDAVGTAMLRVAGIDADFVRVTAGGGHPDLFVHALELIADAAPRLVALEAELLGFAFPDHGSARVRAVRRLRTSLAALFEMATPFVPRADETRYRGPEDAPAFCGAFEGQRSLQAVPPALDTTRSRVRIRPEPVPPRMRAQLERIRDAGGVVIVHAAGRSARAADTLPEHVRTAHADTLATLDRDPLLRLWAAPGIRDEVFYCDDGHLNRIGRERFSAHFMARIAATLDAP